MFAGDEGGLCQWDRGLGWSRIRIAGAQTWTGEGKTLALFFRRWAGATFVSRDARNLTNTLICFKVYGYVGWTYSCTTTFTQNCETATNHPNFPPAHLWKENLWAGQWVKITHFSVFLSVQKASCDRPSSDGEAAHENGHVDCKDQGERPQSVIASMNVALALINREQLLLNIDFVIIQEN